MSATLGDYLAKRELLLRQYLEMNNKLLYLPLELTATPQNPLCEDLLKVYTLNDPLS